MTTETPAWHALSGADALSALDSNRVGTHAEAVQRFARHGPNALPIAAGVHPIMRFLAQFNSALTYFLMTAAFAAGLLGHLVDAVVIAIVVLVNAVVGFAHEGSPSLAQKLGEGAIM